MVVAATRDEKRAGLIDTALGVLSRQGFRKTTLEDIAVAAGIATTSIYYYFPNKQGLLRSVTEVVIGRTLKAMDVALAAVDAPEAKLVATWKVLFSAVRNSGFLLNRQSNPKSSVLAVIDDQIKEFEQKYKAKVRTIIMDGVKRRMFQVHDVDLAVTLLSNGVVGIITNVVGEEESAMLEGKIEKIGDVLMNGMRRR